MLCRVRDGTQKTARTKKTESLNSDGGRQQSRLARLGVESVASTFGTEWSIINVVFIYLSVWQLDKLNSIKKLVYPDNC